MVAEHELVAAHPGAAAERGRVTGHGLTLQRARLTALRGRSRPRHTPCLLACRSSSRVSVWPPAGDAVLAAPTAVTDEQPAARGTDAQAASVAAGLVRARQHAGSD